MEPLSGDTSLSSDQKELLTQELEQTKDTGCGQCNASQIATFSPARGATNIKYPTKKQNITQDNFINRFSPYLIAVMLVILNFWTDLGDFPWTNKIF